MGKRAQSTTWQCVLRLVTLTLIGASLALIGCGGAARGPAQAAPSPVASTAAAPTAKAPAPRAVPVRRSTPLPAVLAAGGGEQAAAPDDGLAGAWARVFLRANPGPFQYVAYEITARGAAGVMSHLKGMMGRRDAVIRTELVSRRRVRAVFTALQRLGAGQLQPPAQPVHVAKNGDDDRRWPDRSATPIYELSYRYGGVERTVVIAAPYRAADPRYGQFINTVRAAVVGRVGPIGYHGATGGRGETGYLYVDSVPTATVLLDGVALPTKTPILAFAARAGRHTVVLENKALGLRHAVQIRIRPGRTTSLELDLR